MRTYSEIPCNRFNARFIISPEFERNRAELQKICSRAQTLRDLMIDLDEWAHRMRAASQRRIDIGLLHSNLGEYRSFIITEVKTIIEPKLITGE